VGEAVSVHVDFYMIAAVADRAFGGNVLLINSAGGAV